MATTTIITNTIHQTVCALKAPPTETQFWSAKSNIAIIEYSNAFFHVNEFVIITAIMIPSRAS